MRNFFKKYLWVFEFIGVAILLAVGIVVKVNAGIFNYIIGLVLIIFGLFRIFPLLKTTKDNLLKLIYAVEILLNIVAGGMLIYEGTKGQEANDIIRYLIGAVLYLRGAIYFYSTTIRKENTDYVKFFVHLAFITLGPIVVLSQLTIEILGWIVLIMAILSAIFIAISGIKNYKNFRYEQLAKDEIKKIKIKNNEKEKENTISDPIARKENVIVPEAEKKDEIRL